ncbi:hypothetical protein L1049_023726 [Liquidambar formosana]|uniref:Sulfotransferase n=1 Tax=Liquidambar formosana TaxID=63359 RepID=A0AAP0RYP0_LIQFO
MESSFSSKRNHVPYICSEEENNSSKTQNKYREIISTLPRDNGGYTTTGSKLFDNLCCYQGFWYHSNSLEGVMLAQEHFKAQPSDILVCSAPKSGTTWLKALTFAIVTRTHFNDSSNPLVTTLPHECLPSLDQKLHNRNPEFPLLATHTPYTSLPKSITSELGCKIVYMCRDPKDAFVSTWHFARKLPIYGQEPISLEAAFELFCKGVSFFGPYWDHVLGYWKASLEWPERVMFIKYEDMMRDTVLYVKRLAEFMGYPFSSEEEREGAVEKIIELCSFENLSNLEVNKNGMRPPRSLVAENNAFFRKGKVGDWQNHLTTEMAERLNQITDQMLGRSGLRFDVSS